MFKSWNKFELYWIGVFVVINLYVLIGMGGTVLSFISSLAGMICVVLVAKGKVANYYFGIIQAVTYSYISYQQNLLGEYMLNFYIYLPIQFVGIYLWKRNSAKVSIQGEDIIVRRMSQRGWVLFMLAMFVCSFAYSIILDKLNGAQIHLDAIAVVLSIGAQLLALGRYAEQWTLWIVVNIITIIIWSVNIITTNSGEYSILVMWIAFLINSIYGWHNWSKLSKAISSTK